MMGWWKGCGAGGREVMGWWNGGDGLVEGR